MRIPTMSKLLLLLMIVPLYAKVPLSASETGKEEKITEAQYREISARNAAIVMAATRQRVKLSWCSIL